ncbi:phage tail-like protein [Agromyces sp. 3263]|uniref:phage tail protein n=1 Tax=Agromyces sp. 3263 TaxID=2817750 RepID=UPI002855A524|nr:phage tail protein [Agromyces sp. 3263]MDR6905365.1 phage tail-like protein [Agromyces sp. 3263]
MIEDTDIAVGVSYVVKIDGESLGEFASCDGLGVEVVLESREEGGNNAYVWQLPTRLKFSNVKLSRPLGKGSSQPILGWIAKAPRIAPSQAEIQARNAEGKPIATWHLEQVIPVRWTGPSLTNDQPKVLTETLELAHHGIKADPPGN